ncbi:hypothetical protein [Pseudoalteromonas denitrificans]|uniref:Uncharacterized protein n=1 Tax=Pseudoalteromonas denitrificans DSM 6059 TaxID=1123010 RepID=A0A1I1H8W9_9GAMM|nr:hypothetical protein [Pseudoalteromonas denitrificans]SFC20414.1 hypothetical protein SAMN02745724_01111 [Pseudoalteromonas denitrificans DSM 6059]
MNINQELMFFWLVIVLMIVSGLSGAYCSYKLKPMSVTTRLIKAIALVSGIAVSIITIYLLIEYPKTTYN